MMTPVAYLRFADVYVNRDRGLLQTYFRDGFLCDATREPNDQTMQDAAELGYDGTPNGVWQSMVEHEIAHSLLSELVWCRASRVLRYCAGASPTVPYHERVAEEAVVLAFQRYTRTAQIPQGLTLPVDMIRRAEVAMVALLATPPARYQPMYQRPPPRTPRA